MEEPLEVARNVLNAEADAIRVLSEKIDGNFQLAVETILGRKGRVIVLGVGKSGHIGKKIAATLASTGQPSFSIHPTEVLHGDLGMMTSDDTCLMVSHSGYSEELLKIIPAIKGLGLLIIAMTSNAKSMLAGYSDIVLETHVETEACPFNLAPTTSTTVMLAYGDALAICLLKLRGFRKEQFAMCHPGGVLGKRLLIKVSDVMISEKLPVNRKSDSFKKALSVMTKRRQGVTMISDEDNRCVGILTDGDIRRAFEKHDRISDIRLEKMYSKNPKTIHRDALAVEALKKMQSHKLTSLVVVDDSQSIAGLIHIHHLLEHGLM